MVPQWGSEVIEETVLGHPQLVYRDRSHHVLEVLQIISQWSAADCIARGDERLTVGDLLTAIDLAADRMLSLGVRPRDYVLLLSHNSPEWLVALWGAWRLGAIPVLGNPWWSDDEIHHALVLVEPKLVVTDMAMDRGALGSAVTTQPSNFRDLLRTPQPSVHVPLPEADEDEPALIVFTSGSTGTAKAVVLSHRSVLANQHNLLARTGRLPGGPVANRQSVVLFTVPLFHIGGVSSVIVGLLSRARMVFLSGRFDQGEVLELVERERVTTWGAVPTMVRRVLTHPDFESRDLSSLRTVSIGGAPVPEELLRQVRERLPGTQRTLTNTWGMTESGGHLTFASGDELVARPSTVGRPVPTVEIVIDQAATDGLGEVFVRSPTVMLGLLGHDGPCGVDDAGFLHTGDIGRLDDDGYLYITGRSKEIVIRGGENISCPLLEHVLGQHPDVIEVAVFGLPDPDFGELVAAVVVTPPDSGLTKAALAAWASERLAQFEVPAHWVITDQELPLLPTGKVDKVSLRTSRFGTDLCV